MILIKSKEKIRRDCDSVVREWPLFRRVCVRARSGWISRNERVRAKNRRGGCFSRIVLARGVQEIVCEIIRESKQTRTKSRKRFVVLGRSDAAKSAFEWNFRSDHLERREGCGMRRSVRGVGYGETTFRKCRGCEHWVWRNNRLEDVRAD